MKNKTKKINLIALVLLAVGCNNHTNSPADSYSHSLQIGSQTLLVEIVKTPEQMQQGLSGRPSMMNNRGMLFDFGSKQTAPTFWMKNMNFNLDFIWISKNKIIG